MVRTVVITLVQYELWR